MTVKATQQATAEDDALRVQAVGFDSDRGQAVAYLFGAGADVMDYDGALVRREARIRGGEAQFSFSSLPDGDYALMVIHDENDNGIIDHNFLGLPAEAMGFSNGFRPGVTSGMPSFEKLRFSLERQGREASAVIRIEVADAV